MCVSSTKSVGLLMIIADRMLTSRSEYRMTLRPENSDMRLTAKGLTSFRSRRYKFIDFIYAAYNVGVVSDERWRSFSQMLQTYNQILDVLKGCVLSTQVGDHVLLKLHLTFFICKGWKSRGYTVPLDGKMRR